MTVMALMFEGERRMIDKSRPDIDNVAPLVTQANTPGENLQNIGEDRAYVLPDPAVGGQNASAVQNGYSTGFRSMFTRLQRFRGQMATPPAIRNAVQGDVGRNNRQASLYAGVMDQNNTYNPASLGYNAVWVGPNGV